MFGEGSAIRLNGRSSNNNSASLEDYYIYQKSSIRALKNLHIIREEFPLHPPALPTALARLRASCCYFTSQAYMLPTKVCHLENMLSDIFFLWFSTFLLLSPITMKCLFNSIFRSFRGLEICLMLFWVCVFSLNRSLYKCTIVSKSVIGLKSLMGEKHGR